MDIEKFKNYINKSSKTKLIFDFDATIARLELNWGDWHPAVASIYKKYDETFIYDGRYVHNMVNDFVRRYGQKIKNEIVEFNYQFEKNNTKGLEENVELVNFIKENAEKYEMYILTNNDSRNIASHLENIKLNGKFKKIIGRNDVIYAKPNTEGMDVIINEEDDFDEFLMIGDSIDSDKAVADKKGIDFYLVDYFKKINYIQ